MDPIGNRSLRLSGANRYQTAAEVSKCFCDYDNTLVVYLATGENYPDALSVGASDVDLGPILLPSTAAPEPSSSG